MSITRQTRTLYSDFVEYKELDRATLSSIHPGILVIFDSTALASLYQYPARLSNEIIRAFSQLRGHAFLPHQALKEFWAALDGTSPYRQPQIVCAPPSHPSKRPSPKKTAPLECSTFRHPPAGPLHRPDYEDSRTHHRYRFH